jgi:hypothetical protein
MTRNERRTAQLLFAPELARGELRPEDLAGPELERAVEVKPVPSAPSRALQRMAMRRGRLDYVRDVVEPTIAARRALLGDAAAGPPRVLLRYDEFPHYEAVDRPRERGSASFLAFDALLREAGVPYLVAVVPRPSRNALDPKGTESRELTDEERAVLLDLRGDPRIAFGLHGLDHRTRHADPRRRSELTGLRDGAVDERLAAGAAILADLALPITAFVAPFNRFSARQWPVLARRFDVVTGGPESVRLLGFHPPAQWRGDAVYLPAYPPLYGTASEVADAVEALAEAGAALWVPAVLHLSAELDDDLRGLARLAAVLGTGLARPWDELTDAVTLSRRAA